MSGIVQFREDAQALEYLRDKGINPNEFAREAFRATLRKAKAKDTAEALSKVHARLPKPIEDLIREDRDAR